MQDHSPFPLIDADHRGLVRAAARLLGPADAEDAVQDAYVRALEADMAALNVAQAWLLTVVRNLAIDKLRRRQWLQAWLAGMMAARPHWPRLRPKWMRRWRRKQSWPCGCWRPC